MRIGIDVREFKKGSYTGLRIILGDFLLHADKHGDNTFVFFGNQHTDVDSLPDYGETIIRDEKNTFIWDQIHLPCLLGKHAIDVFFSPYIKTPLWRVCPYVNTICDVIPLKISKYNGFMAFLEKVHFFLYSLICGTRATDIITLSEDAKSKISYTFGVEPGKLKVAYPSVKVPDVSGQHLVDQYKLGDKYFLYVGNFKKHKNVDNLIKAYGLLPQYIKDTFRLILLGGSDKEMGLVEDKISGAGLSGKVIPVGNIAHDDVYVFLNNASVFVFPSLAEGFGIPPVEALASGVPVAASNIPPMTEVLGEAALFFDPLDAGDISKVMLRFVEDEDVRNNFITLGKERALQFTPEKLSAKIMSVLNFAGREKTLFISSEFPPIRGGIATVVYNLWKRLPKADSVILTAQDKTGKSLQFDKDLNVFRKEYPLGPSMFARCLRTILLVWYVGRLNSQLRVSHNHCAQLMSSGLAGLLMKITRGTSYTVYVYSADILEFSKNPVTKWLIGKILEGSERVISCSDFSKEVAIQSGSVKRDKVTVLTPGVDMDLFNPDRIKCGLRAEHGISEDSKVLITVSRLDARKGHDLIIKILPDMLKECSDLVYLILGTGETRKDLEKLALENGVEKNVIFLGDKETEEIAYYYNISDLFIMVPRYLQEKGSVEGFGCVYIEANACGLPVVAGKSGGVVEAVVDGETGVLVDPEDIDAIRDAILNLIRDEALSKQLGQNGLERVRKDFNWDTRVEELKKYL